MLPGTRSVLVCLFTLASCAAPLGADGSGHKAGAEYSEASENDIHIEIAATSDPESWASGHGLQLMDVAYIDDLAYEMPSGVAATDPPQCDPEWEVCGNQAALLPLVGFIVGRLAIAGVQLVVRRVLAQQATRLVATQIGGRSAVISMSPQTQATIAAGGAATIYTAGRLQADLAAGIQHVQREHAPPMAEPSDGIRDLTGAAAADALLGLACNAGTADPASNCSIFFHYTDSAGFAGISSSGGTLAARNGKVYATWVPYTPSEVQTCAFVGNETTHCGRGTFVVAFRKKSHVQFSPGTQWNELIHYGTLRAPRDIELVWMGPNPFAAFGQ